MSEPEELVVSSASLPPPSYFQGILCCGPLLASSLGDSSTHHGMRVSSLDCSQHLFLILLLPFYFSGN